MNREQLFQLYQEASLERNKSSVLDVQLQVMVAITMLKNILKPTKGGDQSAI
jgi:hypothetical protein